MAQRQKQASAGTEISDIYTKIESFINRNGTIITSVVGVVLAVVIGVMGFRFFYLQPQQQEAQQQMFKAQLYFEKDSFQLALQGDANYPGFLDIIQDYQWTDAANVAHYYAGISYLQTGDYQGAVEFLGDFSTEDQMMRSIKFGAMGDAYMELSQPQKAIDHFLKAAKADPNEFSAPIYLKKAAMAAEKNQQYAKAKEYYQRLSKQYPETSEGKEAEKHLARVRAKTKS